MKTSISDLDLIIANWKERQLIKEITNLENFKLIIKKRKNIYLGIDPTSDSLHLGHLVTIQLLKELAALGCRPIVVIGETTAQIGDPSFRSRKRDTLTNQVVIENQKKIKKQLVKLLPEVMLLNNQMWYKNMSLQKFLQEVGENFTIHKMLEKKSLSSSLESQNLLYSQFTYLLLQAYDFYYLYKNYNCYLQIGGSDQFPNIVLGITLSRKKTASQLPICGVTTNLLTDKKGNKFSKTSQGGIWLDLNKNTSFQIYQFFYNLDDYTSQTWYKIFINQKPPTTITKTKKAKEMRFFQKALFEYFFSWWSGEKELLLFYQKKTMLENWKELKKENYLQLENFLPQILIKKGELKLINLLIKSQLVLSKREARTLLTNKAIKINNQLFVNDLDFQKWLNVQIDCHYLLLAKGKKHYFLVKIIK